MRPVDLGLLRSGSGYHLPLTREQRGKLQAPSTYMGGLAMFQSER